jgi:3-methyladenine DNA glycosylase AlkD
MADVAEIRKAVRALADPRRAALLQGYFKTGPGEYGEGDTFIGIKMPVIRSAVKPFRDLPLDEIAVVLASPIHEHRTAALVILSEQAKAAKKRGDTAGHKRLYDFYLAHTATINNWDLVDVSCRDVVGEYLLTKQNDKPLRRLAKSNEMWERRIGIVSTWSFIRAGELTPTFEISEMLLEDPHDLMHKATGWMLREAGKKDEAALEAFLSRFAHRLPRTALRYSIERMTPERRKYWLAYSG